MLKSKEETGSIIQYGAESFGNALAGIRTALDLLGDSLSANDEDEQILSEFHRGNLLRPAQQLTESIYERLIFAIGDETALIDLKSALAVDARERKEAAK